MTTLTIRNLDPSVRARLERIAALRGQSLEAVMVDALRRVAGSQMGHGATITLTDLDQDLLDKLKYIAEETQVSIEDLVRETLSRAAHLGIEERDALFAGIRAMTPKGVTQTDSVALLRDVRGE